MKKDIVAQVIQEEEVKENSDGDIICPFCEDTGFDKVGLKYHLAYYCEVYNQIEFEPNPLLENKGGYKIEKENKEFNIMFSIRI